MIYNELKQHGTENFPIEFYHIDKFHPKYEMAYHWHSEIEIIRIIDGTLNVTLDNREYQVTAGDIVFVNSETVHGAMPHDCTYECIVFNASYLSVSENTCKVFIESLLNHMSYINEIYRFDKSDFFTIVNKLFDALRTQYSGYTFTVTGCLYELFGYIMLNNLFSKNLSINNVHNEKNVITLKKALAFIRSSYDTQISLDDVASAAGISPKYLCTFFKEMTGKTPFEYLNAYRIERAARKLLNSDLSVTQVAYACGFNDLSYFIKTFKRIKGTTPKNFRRRDSDLISSSSIS